MANTNDDEAGPSHCKRGKFENKRPLSEAELLKILEEGLSENSGDDFDGESEDEYLPSDDERVSSDDIEHLPSDDDGPVHIPLQQPTVTAVDNVKWEDDSNSMKTFHFTKTEELLIPVPGNDPIDYFRHIMTPDFINEIVEQTNRYAVSVFLAPETKEKSRITAWRDVTSDELLIFLGLLLHMGNIRLNRLNDYWKTDALFSIRIFAQNMSRNRFLLIMRTLHFAENPEAGEPVPSDRLYKVRKMIKLFNQRMTEIYYPDRELSLDESMVLWRGRLTFRQYIKNKRHKYGIKLYMLTTPAGLILNFMVYTGMLDDFGGKGHSEKVVMNLLDGKLDVGHSLFMDNYYNSFHLARRLLDRKTYCTGTVRMDRKNYPKEVKTKKLKRGETVAKYSDGVMIAKWKDKREVSYISNEYVNDMVEVQNRRSQTTSKPLPIVKYNKFMSGVDRQDQMLSYYPCERKTIRWPTKIFVHLLQLMLINAHQLYNKYSANRMTLYDFRLSVIKAMLKVPTVTTPAAKRRQGDEEHHLTVRDAVKSGKVMRKQCKKCYASGKRKDTIYVCKSCPNLPGYCLDCATITHN